MSTPRWFVTVTLPLVAMLAGCGAESPPPASNPPVAETKEAPPSELACRTWQAVDSGTTASFRGLDAVDDNIVWVSGTGGKWGLTTDGGSTWSMRSVPGAEELDFRDVDAFSAEIAYLMSAGPGELSRIFKTLDGGATWQLQFTNSSPEGFFDGMAFWDSERGLAYGDPVDGRFTVLATEDGGATWNQIAAEGMPPALEGEAGFAASGTGLAVYEGGHAWFGTGGSAARVFRSRDYGRSWTVVDTPMLSGESSTGIFSIVFTDPLHGVAVGGNYTQPAATTANAIRTVDGGLSWIAIEPSPPSGYRSAVAEVPGSDGQILVTVGTSGSDLSLDGGQRWQAMGEGTYDDAGYDEAGYNAVSFAGSPCAGWAAGPEGRLAKLAD